MTVLCSSITTSPYIIGRDAAHGIVRGGLDRHGLGNRIDAQVGAAEIDDIRQLARISPR
jgi:hypothetical protein